MARCVALDLAQLFAGLEKLTPRGIDRVDLAYARHFLEQWRGDCVGTLPTPWGIRWFDRERSLRAVGFIEDHWGETDARTDDPAFQWAISKLRGEKPDAVLPQARTLTARLMSGFAKFVRHQGLALGRPVRSLPGAAIYLNTGQVTLGFSRYLDWLQERPDVEPVVMLHDVIPIEHPEYCKPSATALHRRALANTARYAARIIVTTEAAQSSIRRELEPLGSRDIPMLAVPLPVSAPFLQPTIPWAENSDVPYFIVCGTIEPRKNHLMLLNVWRELARLDPETCPKLVLAGARSKTSAPVVDLLERCEGIRDHVVEVAGLSTPALRQLMAGARALLMPSFAEGFGLPIVEALALGTPVIASDLASHREAGGGRATYIDPIDGTGWLEAIRARTRLEGARREQIAETCSVWTHADYFGRIEPFVVGEGDYVRGAPSNPGSAADPA